MAIDPVCRISKALSAIFLASTKSASSLSLPTAQRVRIGNLWDIGRKVSTILHYGRKRCAPTSIFAHHHNPKKVKRAAFLTGIITYLGFAEKVFPRDRVWASAVSSVEPWSITSFSMVINFAWVLKKVGLEYKGQI